MSISIRDVLLPSGRVDSVYVEGNRIAAVGEKREADVTIDGRRKALLPGFVNTHTHAAMTLLRGYADDMELHAWLTDRILPAEAKLTPEAIYWGTKLACLEMIKSGTTAFNDMYFHMDRAALAVAEMGIRGFMGVAFFDGLDPAFGEEQLKKVREAAERIHAMRSERVVPAIAPHAIYTVSPPTLRAAKDLADARGWLYHIHVSETKREVDEARRDHGKTPVQLLDAIGALGANVIAAHSVWLEDDEVRTYAARGVKVAHCPISNMKLSVGRAMPLAAMREAGVTVSLGTDGAASNNSLDMFQTMKVGALLHKFASGRPTVAGANEVLDMATREGARALRLDAGDIAVGKLADFFLVDLRRPELTPLHSLASNLVYAATGDSVDTVVCDGRVLMRDRHVPGEEEVRQKAASVAADLLQGA